MSQKSKGDDERSKASNEVKSSDVEVVEVTDKEQEDEESKAPQPLPPLHQYKIRCFFHNDGARFTAGTPVRGFITISPELNFGRFTRPFMENDGPPAAGRLHIDVQLSGVMLIGRVLTQQHNINEGAFMRQTKEKAKTSLRDRQNGSSPSSGSNLAWETYDNFILKYFQSMKRSPSSLPAAIMSDLKTYFCACQALHLMYRPPPHFESLPPPSFDKFKWRADCNEWGNKLCQRYLPNKSLLGKDDRGSHVQLLLSSPVIRLPEPDLRGEDFPLPKCISFSLDLPSNAPPSIDRGKHVTEGELVTLLYSIHVTATWDADPKASEEEHMHMGVFEEMTEPQRLTTKGLPWAHVPCLPRKRVAFSLPLHVDPSPIMFLKPLVGPFRSPVPFLGGCITDVLVDFEGLSPTAAKKSAAQNSVYTNSAPYFGGPTARPAQSKSIDATACMENLPVRYSLLNAPSIRHLSGHLAMFPPQDSGPLPVFDFKPMRNNAWRDVYTTDVSDFDLSLRKELLSTMDELPFPGHLLFDLPGNHGQAGIDHRPMHDDMDQANTKKMCISVRRLLSRWNPWLDHSDIVPNIALPSCDDSALQIQYSREASQQPFDPFCRAQSLNASQRLSMLLPDPIAGEDLLPRYDSHKGMIQLRNHDTIRDLGSRDTSCPIPRIVELAASRNLVAQSLEQGSSADGHHASPSGHSSAVTFVSQSGHSSNLRDIDDRIANHLWARSANPSPFAILDSHAVIDDLKSTSKLLVYKTSVRTVLDWENIEDSDDTPSQPKPPPQTRLLSRRSSSRQEFDTEDPSRFWGTGDPDDRIVIRQRTDLRLGFDENRSFGSLVITVQDLLELPSWHLPPHPSASVLAYLLVAHGWIDKALLKEKHKALVDSVLTWAPWLRTDQYPGVPRWMLPVVDHFCDGLKKEIRSYFLSPGSTVKLTFNTTRATVISTQADISLIRRTFWRVNDVSRRSSGMAPAVGTGFLQQFLGVGFTGLMGGGGLANADETVVHRWPSIKLLYSRIRSTEITLPTDILPTTFYSDAINVTYALAIRFTCIGESPNGRPKDDILPILKKAGQCEPLHGSPFPPPIGSAQGRPSDLNEAIAQPQSNVPWNVTPEAIVVAPGRAGTLLAKTRQFDKLMSWAIEQPLVIMPPGLMKNSKTMR